MLSKDFKDLVGKNTVDISYEIHIESQTSPEIKEKLKEKNIEHRKIQQRKFYDFSDIDSVEQNANDIVDDMICFINKYVNILDETANGGCDHLNGRKGY